MSCAITIEEIKYYSKFRKCIDFFQVFHAPGSFALVYKYREENSVIYLGDVCFGNSFYHGMKNCIDEIERIDMREKTIICDAALVDKKEDSIGDDTAEDIIYTIETSISRRNTFFVSKSPETLLYSYLLFFRWAILHKSTKVKVVVSDDTYNMLRLLWRSLVYRDNYKDLFIDNVIDSEINFIETYRLYALSNIDGIENYNNTIYFLTTSELDRYSESIPLKKSDVMLVGVWTACEGIPEIVTKSAPRSVIRVSSADWSFHSNEIDLVTFAKAVVAIRKTAFSSFIITPRY